MSLTTKIKGIRDVLLTACSNTYHYEKPERTNLSEYIVWQEDGEGTSFDVDNRKSEQVIQFSVNLYTKTEYSTVIDTLQTKFTDSTISFSLVSVTFETDTKFIHYEWRCEV